MVKHYDLASYETEFGIFTISAYNNSLDENEPDWRFTIDRKSKEDGTSRYVFNCDEKIAEITVFLLKEALAGIKNPNVVKG